MRNFLFLLFIFSLSAFSEELKPYRVWLKPGSLVTNLKDKKEYQIEKGMFVNVLEINPSRRDLFIIYNKQGRPTYSTGAWGIVEIAKDIQILPDVDAEITYPAPSVFKTKNAFASFNTQFNVYLENLQTPVFNSVNDQDFTTNTLGNRFELRTLYNSSLPVNFGLSVNYEIAKWENELEQLELSVLSFGPHFQRTLFSEDNIAVSLLFGAEYAPIYTTSSALGKDKFSAVILDVGAEAEWDSHMGKWSLGVHYRKHDLTLSSTDRADNTSVPETIGLNSIGGMLGYKYEWEL